MTKLQAWISAGVLVGISIVGSVVFIAWHEGVITSVLTSAGKMFTDVAREKDCPEGELREFFKKSDGIVREFEDDLTRAGSTPRIAVSGVVGDLQAERRRYQALTVPACANDYKSHVDAGMERSIKGLLAFMASEPDSAVKEYAAQAAQDFDSARKERVKLDERLK